MNEDNSFLSRYLKAFPICLTEIFTFFLHANNRKRILSIIKDHKVIIQIRNVPPNKNIILRYLSSFNK